MKEFEEIQALIKKLTTEKETENKESEERIRAELEALKNEKNELLEKVFKRSNH